MLTFQVTFKDVKTNDLKKINIHTAKPQKDYDKFHDKLAKKNRELTQNAKMSIMPRVVTDKVTADSIIQKNKIETEVLYISMRAPRIDPDAIVCANELGLPILSRVGVEETMFLKDKRYQYVSKEEVDVDFFDELTMAINRKIGKKSGSDEGTMIKMVKNDLKSASWIMENNVKLFVRTGLNKKLDDLCVKPSDIGNVREIRAVDERWHGEDEGVTLTYSIYSNDFNELIRTQEIDKAIRDVKEHIEDEHHGAKGRKVYIIYDGEDSNKMKVKKFINELSYEIDGQVVEYRVNEKNDVKYSLIQTCRIAESELEDETMKDNVIFEGKRTELKEIILNEIEPLYRKAPESGREDIDKMKALLNSERYVNDTDVIKVERIPLPSKKPEIAENVNKMRKDILVKIGKCDDAKDGAIIMSLERELGNNIWRGEETWQSRMQKRFPETSVFYAYSDRVGTGDGIKIDKAIKNKMSKPKSVYNKEDLEKYEIIGIEPNYVESLEEELDRRNVDLELRKLISAYSSAKNRMILTEMIACENYNGNTFIKFIEQMIAASVADKGITMFVEDESFKTMADKVINKIRNENMEIREVYQLFITEKYINARDFLGESGDIASEVAEDKKDSQIFEEEGNDEYEEERNLVKEDNGNEELSDVRDKKEEKEESNGGKVRYESVIVNEKNDDKNFVVIDVYEEGKKMLTDAFNRSFEELREAKTKEQIEIIKLKSETYVELFKIMNRGMGELEEIRKENVNKVERVEEFDKGDNTDNRVVEMKEKVVNALMLTHIDFMEKVEMDERPIIMVARSEKYSGYETKMKGTIRYGETNDRKYNVFESNTIKKVIQDEMRSGGNERATTEAVLNMLKISLHKRGYVVETNEEGDIIIRKY
ncbi:Cypovirus VP5 [Hubei lepidoptera virus 3]|uniref:Cypovirus VP5 n=1 Tax=Hubei lepidoptera virus 3 TaxID=1922905 RepID=UPI00090B5626|nr:Cypovirus VP5 [Hubei lepidoptera virus 3]APG79097.1 Cypovirus VP5 [Hubei lepidoptera virus 3]